MNCLATPTPNDEWVIDLSFNCFRVEVDMINYFRNKFEQLQITAGIQYELLADNI